MTLNNRPVRAAMVLVPLVALGACTVAPPSGPSIVALPGHGKSLAQFQQDDQYCRNYAQERGGKRRDEIAYDYCSLVGRLGIGELKWL